MNNAKNYSMTILSMLAILGIIVNAIFLYLGGNIATSTIWTYGFSILSLCGLTLISFGKSATASGFFQNILGIALPGFLISSRTNVLVSRQERSISNCRLWI